MGHLMIDQGVSALAVDQYARFHAVAETPAIEAAVTRRLVIVDLPVASRPSVTIAPGAMVRTAVSQVLGRGGAIPAPEAGAGDDVGAAEATNIDDAVVFAHEQRIATLRTRLAAAQAGGALPQLVTDMARRLRRAEAAHRLALARVDGAACAAGAPGPLGRPTVVAAAPEHRGGSLLPGRSVAGAAVFSPSPARWSALQAGLRPMAAGRTVHASIGDRPVRGRVARRAVPSGLANARRSLAAARRSLGAARVAGGEAMPRMVIASLWHWQGSASWSLSPDRSAAS